MKRLLAVALALLTVATGCGKRSADASFAEAEGQYKAAKAVADTLRNREGVGKLFEPTLEAYAKVLEEFPDDPLAEMSLFKTATIRNNEMRDPEGAVDSYKSFANRYPEAKQAPVATYLTAYLYNNELHRLDSAASWYRRFLERFPQHEMAASAQFELNTLGRPADELLPPDGEEVPRQPVAAQHETQKAGARE